MGRRVRQAACLPVSAQQKTLFDAIDSQRTIAEIVPQIARRAAARVLFEGLWGYDQVVFDTSALAGRRPTDTDTMHAPTT